MRDRPYCAKLYLTLRICKVPLIGARGRIVPCAQLQIGKACRKILQVVIKINRAAFKRNATNAETKQIDIGIARAFGQDRQVRVAVTPSRYPYHRAINLYETEIPLPADN